MNITMTESETLDKYQDILIHFGYSVLNFDFRKGFFSAQSSIYDFGSEGLEHQDYHTVAKMYDSVATDHDTYTEGRSKYFKLLNRYTDRVRNTKFNQIYHFHLPEKLHLLEDIVNLLNQTFPNRNWAEETVFIKKQFDSIDQRKITVKQDKHKNNSLKDTNLIHFPLKKKLSHKEIKKSFNEYLMVQELGMTPEDAHQLAKNNYEQSKIGQKFNPYLP